MKTLVVATLLLFFITQVSIADAKGGGGGGHASSGGRSSFSSSRTSSTRTSTARPKTAAQVKAESIATARQKATETKYSQAAAKQPTTKKVNGKTYTKGSTVGVNGYSPRFAGGYTAPPGSVVYYQQSSSAWDWFPMYYIMSHNGNQQAVVQQPNGQSTPVQEEGTDGMYFFNWFLTVVIILGIIVAIVYFVNKATQEKTNYATI